MDSRLRDSPLILAEVRTAGTFLEARDMDRMIYQLLDSLILCGRYGNYGNPKLELKGIHVDGAAILPYLIHHVKRYDYRQAQLYELQRKIEIAFDIRGIDDVYDAIRVTLEYEIPGNDLLVREGRQGIYARGINDRDIIMTADDTALAVNGDTGKVADMLVRSRKLVEQRGLAAVLVSRKGEDDRHVLRYERLLRRLMLSPFSDMRMVGKPMPFIHGIGLRSSALLNSDARGIFLPYRQLISTDEYLDGITHRSNLYQRDYRPWGYSHVKEMPSQGLITTNGENPAGFSYRKHIKRHTTEPFLPG